MTDEFKGTFTLDLVQNNDDGGKFIFYSNAMPPPFFNKEGLINEFKQRFSKFVDKFEISKIDEFMCIDPYMEVKITICSVPNPAILNPKEQNRSLKMIMNTLKRKFRCVYLQDASVVVYEPGQNKTTKP